MKASQKLISKILSSMQGMHKKREQFMNSIFAELLSLRGRHNFLNLARYGAYSEKSYRLHYEESFDFLEFNSLLSQGPLSSEKVLAFDPSFIPKSGKQTPHIDTFWNGCTQQAIRGLEISGLALVDIENNTAVHLEAIQTPDQSSLGLKDWSRVDHYADCILSRKDKLAQLCDYLCVDGYFAKESFIKPIVEQTDLELICKLRQDADLRYLYTGPQLKRTGRPRAYAGKINLKKIDKTRLIKCYQDDQIALYEGVVNAKNLKRNIKLCYLELLANGQATGKYRVLFSTDLKLDGHTIYRYYKARFQIEFLFRDAKQYTGLTQCEARSESKMHFHYNAALTAVNIAKVVHHLDKPIDKRGPFSMADVKTSYFNEKVFDLVLCNLDIDPELHKIRYLRQKVHDLGRIAA